ncbi:MAG: hypothetical protein IKA36_01160 [Clostridia bacterium]|nr:hypothetical protein [Clostridia bacterium]
MTTLWARMFVFEAMQNNDITKECAEYFDNLLKEYEKTNDGIEISKFNTDEPGEYCVLQNIGQTKNNEFDVLEYIKKMTFEEGCTKDGKTAFLANIIDQDYKRLAPEITKYLDSEKADLKGTTDIYDYLCCTYFMFFWPNEIKFPLSKKITQKIIDLGGLSYFRPKEEAENSEQSETNEKPAYTDLIDSNY